MKKITTIVGARPQFIKAAALSRLLRKLEGVKEILVHTGQHFDDNMSEIFFEQMHIPKPDYNLEIEGLSHAAMTGRMLEEIEKVLLLEKPDLVLVYGDTNSTLAGALAAAKLHISVAHVEAGLRSFNRRMPEEVNRVLTDHIADLLFAPTRTAVDNLGNEGIASEKIHFVGDVMQDAALYYAPRARKPDFPEDHELSLREPFVLCTLHRAENTDDSQRLKEIFAAVMEISRKTPVIMPLHPRTRNRLAEIGMKISDDATKLCLVDPVGYLEMIWLLQHCSLVLTDSGGLQKEAYFFKKPCITLRDETEWVELVEAGVNRLAGAVRESIICSFHQMREVEPDAFGADLYGGGRACRKIAKILQS